METQSVPTTPEAANTPPEPPNLADNGLPTRRPPVFLTPSGRRALKVFDHEVRAYLKELPRLLAEGEVKRTVLIRGDHFSVWDTERDALQAGAELFGLEPYFVKPIDRRDPERYALLLAAAEDVPCP